MRPPVSSCIQLSFSSSVIYLFVLVQSLCQVRRNGSWPASTVGQALFLFYLHTYFFLFLTRTPTGYPAVLGAFLYIQHFF